MSSYLKFFSRYSSSLLFGLNHSFFSSFGQTFYVAFFVPFLLTDFNLSNTSYGLYYSVATLGASLLLSYFGALLDRSSPRNFSFFVAFGLSMSAFILSQAQTIGILVLGLFLLRLFGQGLCPLVMATVTAKSFDKNRGKALSIAGLGQPMAEAVLPMIAALSIAGYGWRNTWLFTAIFITLIFFPLTYLFSQNFKTEVDLNLIKPSTEPTSRLKFLTDKNFLLLLPTACMNGFILTGFFIQQGFIISERGWSKEIMALAFFGFGITRFASSIYSGVLIDKFSSFSLLKFYLIPLILALLSVTYFPTSLGAYLYLILCGLSVGFSANLMTSIWSEIYGPQEIGLIRGLNGTFAVISTAIAPPIMGYFVDTGWSLPEISSFFIVILAFSYSLIFFHPMKKRTLRV